MALCLIFSSNDSLDLIIKLIASTVGILGLGKAILEYTRAQKWKRVEFLAKEMKEFSNDIHVKRAFLMLDWQSYKIKVFNDEIADNEDFYFNDELLKSALVFHENKKDGIFTKEEALIRLIFDGFLEKLSTFQNYIDNRLFGYKDLKPYLIYYLRIIGDLSNNRKTEDVRKQIWEYIVKYDNFQVIKLLSGYGYKIN